MTLNKTNKQTKRSKVSPIGAMEKETFRLRFTRLVSLHQISRLFFLILTKTAIVF